MFFVFSSLLCAVYSFASSSCCEAYLMNPSSISSRLLKGLCSIFPMLLSLMKRYKSCRYCSLMKAGSLRSASSPRMPIGPMSPLSIILRTFSGSCCNTDDIAMIKEYLSDSQKGPLFITTSINGLFPIFAMIFSMSGCSG